MADLPTRLDYYALARQFVLQRTQKLDPSIVDVQGSDANIVVGTSAVLADAVTKQIGYAASRLTLDGSYDEDLDRFVWDRYQQTRKGAAPALGQVRLYRATAALGAGSVPTSTSILSLGGTEYITTQPGTFGSGTLDNVLVNVRAVQAGHVTQVGANMLRRWKNASQLFDPSIQVNNDLATAGGSEREDDDTFKNRIRGFWNAARRGTLGAIEFGARTVLGVDSASAIEALTPQPLPARVVNLYIADPSGVASVPLAQQVQAALNDYRAGGIAVLVFTSIPFIQAVTLKLAFLSGVDQQTLSNQIVAAMVEFINNLPVNGPLYMADLFTVLRRFVADGLVQGQSSIVSPTADVIPTVGQTIRTTAANFTLT